MADDGTPSDALPRAVILALMHEAAHAVERINLATAIQLQQPAQPPSETEAFRERLILTVLEPILGLWNVLEPDQLRAAGSHLAMALIREMLTTSAQGVAVLRQFQSQPRPAESPSPTPGSPTTGEQS